MVTGSSPGELWNLIIAAVFLPFNSLGAEFILLAIRFMQDRDEIPAKTSEKSLKVFLASRLLLRRKSRSLIQVQLKQEGGREG